MGILILVTIIIATIVCIVVDSKRKKQRRELLNEILDCLNLKDIDRLLGNYDDSIIVKSRQALNNYDDLKYIKERDCFESVKKIT